MRRDFPTRAFNQNSRSHANINYPINSSCAACLSLQRSGSGLASRRSEQPLARSQNHEHHRAHERNRCKQSKHGVPRLAPRGVEQHPREVHSDDPSEGARGVGDAHHGARVRGRHIKVVQREPAARHGAPAQNNSNGEHPRVRVGDARKHQQEQSRGHKPPGVEQFARFPHRHALFPNEAVSHQAGQVGEDEHHEEGQEVHEVGFGQIHFETALKVGGQPGHQHVHHVVEGEVVGHQRPYWHTPKKTPPRNGCALLRFGGVWSYLLVFRR
mmetsp:Transcript_22082/g.42141  ORF Transcript_22082/g.42141 Transcript_22082/m.42141 type:complete len:270 (-) Transcript_22082:767-1576(-)